MNQLVNQLVVYNHTVHNYYSPYYMHEIVEAGPSTQSSDSDDSLPTVASGDDEPSIVAEDCSVSISSLTIPEEGCSSTTLHKVIACHWILVLY